MLLDIIISFMVVSKQDLDNFYNRPKIFQIKNTDWVLQVNKVLGYHSDEGSLKDILNIIGEQPLYKYILDKYKRITNR